MPDSASEPKGLAAIQAALAKRQQIDAIKAATAREERERTEGKHNWMYRDREEIESLPEAEARREARIMHTPAAWDTIAGGLGW